MRFLSGVMQNGQMVPHCDIDPNIYLSFALLPLSVHWVLLLSTDIEITH